MISEAVAFERGVSPLLDKLLDERLSDVLSFSPDPDIERRIEELAGKSTEGMLSSEVQRAPARAHTRCAMTTPTSRSVSIFYHCCNPNSVIDTRPRW